MDTSAQLKLISGIEPTTTAENVKNPVGYKGLHAFHKYWGKKPLEPLLFLIDTLTRPNCLVVDPFMGSCASGVAALRSGRRFVGIDLNPAAVQIASILLSPPSVSEVQQAFHTIQEKTKTNILDSYYSPSDRSPITHCLWKKSELIQLWVTRHGRNGRREYEPSREDITLSKQFDNYEPKKIRQPHFFNNSRINTRADLTLRDLFTGRALRNIEILLEAISSLPINQQLPMKLALTASVGQMSKMVFAITGRGKTSGTTSKKIEVGSWVIGYWRPALHFEINVWHCFESRTRKFISALYQAKTDVTLCKSGSISEVLKSVANYSLNGGDVLDALQELPDDSADLILTDPPHSDRIPYLELSELWNSILNLEANFSREIIVSNAKERKKTLNDYSVKMRRFVELAITKVKSSGSIVVLFNARNVSSWNFFSEFEAISRTTSVRYVGHFPIVYSAGSVVQDNRKGGLKNDFALVFSPGEPHYYPKLTALPGWSFDKPIIMKN